MTKLIERAFLGNNEKLQHDNVYPVVDVLALTDITGHPVRRGLENVIISNGSIVNVVSNKYALLDNRTYFGEVERNLINEKINFKSRSINRNNGSFAVDYILNDDNYSVIIKNGLDKIRPMLRFTNSYDGSTKTAGHFGFFREVCSNGLHVAESKIGFSVKHVGQMSQVCIPKIQNLVQQFMDNEFYEIRKKFDVLAETPITDLEEFVKITADNTKLFKFESSEKNPEPSLNARLVIETIQREAAQMDEKPTLWHGYNAFNEILHGKLKKSFQQQHATDSLLFNEILQLA